MMIMMITSVEIQN